jgi:hypothetical protein
MVSEVSGRFPIAGSAAFAGAKRHDRMVKWDEGADRLRSYSVSGKTGELEDEKKTDAQQV